jgi:hypothetical protein
LLRQRPAAEDNPLRHPGRKSLFPSKAASSFSPLLHCTHLTAPLMEHASPAQGKTEAKGVPTVLRQRHRLLGARQPLVRIA